MSAKNENVPIAAGDEWVRLTDSGATVSHISVQNVGKGDLIVMGTTGSAPLDGDADGRRVGRGESIDNIALADLFPGVSATQVWARSLGTETEAFVSHSASVETTDVADEIALGKRPGITAWHKWGYNLDIDTAATETIWEPGGTATFLTTASTLSFVSASGNDADAGTGAHGVVLYGIDANRSAVTEVVMLNGTTPVVTTSTWLGINRLALFRAGSSTVNEGKITVTAVTGGSVQATIPATQGTTQQAIFFTQDGHTALATDLSINVVKLSGGGGSFPVVTVLGWVLSFVSNAKYEVFRHTLDTQKENSFTYGPKNSFPVGENSVLYFTAETDLNNTEVSMRYSLQEHKVS